MQVLIYKTELFVEHAPSWLAPTARSNCDPKLMVLSRLLCDARRAGSPFWERRGRFGSGF